MMSDAIHRRAERHFAPWKNGGGETAEIICVPQGAGFDDFAWRISTAKVEGSGPFSTFAAVSRNLTVLEGGAMSLTVGSGPPVRLDTASGPFAFSGETPCTAELHGAGLLDLNVMVRAPYRCAVLREGEALPEAAAPRASYLFALRDLPKMGLQKHDLRDLGEGVPTGMAEVPAGALLIVISDEAEI
ncbi:HutD family protein [Salipiger sp. PrR002]|uniref:HutD/Ves family protein n=1 Tax=Salipiger sp. PrR002 TaxID=2706489 RepID=UPI0019453416|nr:HutD family protein [Salipiger sp. PrR002]